MVLPVNTALPGLQSATNALRGQMIARHLALRSYQLPCKRLLGARNAVQLHLHFRKRFVAGI